MVKKLAAAALFALLLALPASGATPRILPTQDAWPVWSPDGRHIAFTRIHPARNLMELEVVDVRTHKVSRIAQNGYQLLPVWDGNAHLGYQAGGSVYLASLSGPRVRVGVGGAPGCFHPLVRVVGSRLVIGDKVWADHVIGRPACQPSPNGQVAFRRDDGIYMTVAPGRADRIVGAPNPGDPVWSPDGVQLAFTIRDEIWVASRGPVPARAIARAKPGASTPSWSPDGTRVVYTWRGGVTSTSLTGRSTLLYPAAGPGASMSPRDATVAYAGPRPLCPGHLAIRTTVTLTGTCAVNGTRRADVIEGSLRENDVILARGGNDKVHANDRHTDRVDCGPGRDEVWADRLDKLRGCEVIHR